MSKFEHDISNPFDNSHEVKQIPTQLVISWWKLQF